MKRSRSLEQLDGQSWGDAPDDATSLVQDVHRLRRVAVGELQDDDLRLLLGQHEGTEWLIPIALDRLVEEPLTGDSYPGDLLRAVLHAGSDFWTSHPAELMRLWSVRQTLEAIRSEAAAALDDPRWPAFG